MIRGMKPKQVPARLKEVLADKIEESAAKGRLIPYRELSAFASREYPESFPTNNRRRLINCLDAINRDSIRKGILLSAIVVNDDGMPDSGFFQKAREGEWLAGRLSSKVIGHETDEKIFRHEASEVFRVCGAPVRFHVFMDLQNIMRRGAAKLRGWRVALKWLSNRGNVSGYAYSTQLHQKRLATLKMHCIRKRDIPDTGKDAVDAALLVEFGRVVLRIPERDFICIMGSDGIYNQAADIATRNGVKVLRFCTGEALDWKPESGEFYLAFAIGDSAEWNAKWEAKNWPDKR